MVRGRALKDQARDLASLAQTVGRMIIACETDGWCNEPSPGTASTTTETTGDQALKNLTALETRVGTLRREIEEFLNSRNVTF
jgi:hypothetical protein